ncbi:MAG TPA: PAS domain S-box protein, partial [Pyrinomonadaceae bacterium]|nr:PAS domain S-box protein [Pyrinomonadaceae bacterium]
MTTHDPIPHSAEERFRAVLEQAPFSIQIIAPDGRILRVNRAWEELWGVTLEQIEGYNILEDRQLVEKGVMPYLRRAFAGEAVEIPQILYDPDETIPGATRHARPRRWTKAVAYPIKDGGGRVLEVVLIHEDVTARVAAEERYRSLLENANDIIYAHDLEGNYLSINRAGA